MSPAGSASGTSRRAARWGFDHWWGFLTGDAGQYDPIITQDNTTIGVPEGKDGKLYYFPDDITDKAVEWLHAVRATDANKPCTTPPAALTRRVNCRPIRWANGCTLE